MSVLAFAALLSVGQSVDNPNNHSSHFAQPPERVKWSVSRVLGDPASDTQFVQITAEIEPGWHVYSLTQSDEGPFPLRVSASTSAETKNVFSQPSKSEASKRKATNENRKWRVITGVRGPKPEVQPESPFGIPVEWYSGTAKFTVPLSRRDQNVGESTPGTASLVLRIRYQACSDRLCLPPRSVDLVAHQASMSSIGVLR